MRLSLKVKSHRCTGNLYRVFGAQEEDCKGLHAEG